MESLSSVFPLQPGSYCAATAFPSNLSPLFTSKATRQQNAFSSGKCLVFQPLPPALVQRIEDLCFNSKSTCQDVLTWSSVDYFWRKISNVTWKAAIAAPDYSLDTTMCPLIDDKQLMRLQLH